MNALRSFEAAARHQSFALAAVELSVSPAAVGFQVKRIEDDLGFALFIRKHRAVELTPEGAKLMQDLTRGFDIIQAAWNAVDAPPAPSALRVTAPVAAVKRWLFDEFAAAPVSQSDVPIAWDMSQLNRALDENGPDAAIRYALAPPEDLFAEPILRPWFTPHMRPDIARKITSVAQLEEAGLINVDYAQDNTRGLTAWVPWFAAQGLEPPLRFAMNCADTMTAVDMAVETGHVAMGGYFASLKHVSAGRLVAPFGIAVRPRSRFWFLCRKGREKDPGIAWLRDRIQACAAKLEQHSDGLEMVDF